jgi:amidase
MPDYRTTPPRSDRSPADKTNGILTRRALLQGTARLAAGALLAGGIELPAAWATEPELSILDLQALMAAGPLTARALVQSYLDRIEALNWQGPQLRAVIEVNPDALAIAEQLDAERQARGPRGPLHGIPILLKDNIDTADRMMTTAGSYALVGDPPAQDATVARKLREAGAILLGKANLMEWAGARGYSVPGPFQAWSARGGVARNPYVLTESPWVSSSGSGVATSAGMCAAALGTETWGSIMGPAYINGVVGIRPTVGLASRAGIIPNSHSRDTVGPMTLTVADAALILGAMTGVDPRDPATDASAGKALTDYTTFLDPNGLKGARIGVPFGRGGAGTSAAMQVLEAAGAVLVPVHLSPAAAGPFSTQDSVQLAYEFKHDLNAYLATRTGVPIGSLADLIAFNQTHPEELLSRYDQQGFLDAQKRGPLTDPAYLTTLEQAQAARVGIDTALDQNQLDAMVAPGDYPSVSVFRSGTSRAGYPMISVPAGFDRGLPISLFFFGTAYSEPTLFRLAYAFEQLTRARRPPQFLPSRPLV